MPAPAPRPVVVFVPGLGLTADAARPTARLLHSPARVVELPGYGRRRRRGETLDPPALGERLLAAVRAMVPAPETVVLVGHSAGCQIVAEAAARAPELVAGLVLVGPTTDPRAPGWLPLAGRWLATAVREKPGQVPLLVRCYATTGLASMARGMNVARRHRIDRVLPAAHAATVVVRGPDDRIAPADWSARLAGLAGGRLVTLDAGGHMVVITHPRPVADVVDGLAADLRARTP